MISNEIILFTIILFVIGVYSKEEEEELSSPGRIVRIETPGEIPLI